MCRLSYADAGNRGDPRELVGHVLDSDVVVLFQSEEVLFCPRRVLELYAAAAAGIPIVSLVCSDKGYDAEAAKDYLLHLDTSLPEANPSAIQVLEANDAPPMLRVAQVLWTCLPNVISVPLNSSGSENAIRAAVADLIEAVQLAKAIPVPLDGGAWLEGRKARDRTALAAMIASSTLRGTQRGRMLRRIDERVDALKREVAEVKAERKEEVAELQAARKQDVEELKARKQEVAALKAELAAERAARRE